MLAARCSAQMVTYDISNGENFTKGEFDITCPANSYCMLPNKPGFEIFSFVSTYIDADPMAYRGNTTYYWNDDEYAPGRAPYIRGRGCDGDKCIITCDTGCSCRLGPGTGNAMPGELTQDCTITETLPDASIPDPDELVAFGSASQDPDVIAIRCSGTFIRSCSIAPFSDGYFVSQTNRAGPDYDYAMDFTDCNADDGNFCYIACDPRCSCSETMGNKTGLECAIGTAPPTSAPSMEPAPTPTTPPTSGVTSAGGIMMPLVGGLVTFLLMTTMHEV